MRSSSFFGMLLAAAAIAIITISGALSDTAPTESEKKTALIIGPCTTEC